MSHSAFDTLIEEGLAQPFAGWDFSWLDGRWDQTPLPWDYEVEAARSLHSASCAVDLGTGGGEVLARVVSQASRLGPSREGQERAMPSSVATPASARPGRYAVEGWAPNVPIARTRLGALGLPVVWAAPESDLPFRDGAFDLVLNRHSGYSPAELSRITAPGGRFLTQQVGGRNMMELNELLMCPIPFEFGDWSLAGCLDALRDAGFSIKRAVEAYPEVIVRDIASIIYYLRAIPWQIADFEIHLYRDRLFRLHRRIEAEGMLVLHAHRFLVEANRIIPRR